VCQATDTRHAAPDSRGNARDVASDESTKTVAGLP
jgi:hypothetical protein